MRTVRIKGMAVNGPEDQQLLKNFKTFVSSVCSKEDRVKEDHERLFEKVRQSQGREA